MKNIQRQIAFIVLLFLLSAGTAFAADLVLTGSIGSSAKQVVVAPQGSRWQIQIQWMEEEGKVVEKGQPVVVFDGASEQTQLVNNRETLDRLELEYKQLKLSQDQAVIDANGRVAVSEMRVEKARIEASVPAGEVSAYDKGQYELALQRAMLEQVKATEALKRAEQERDAEMTKKKVDILKTKEQIRYLEGVMSKLRVLADFTGPVNYAIHPWFGEKVTAGMNVRPSWKVLDVQSTDNFQIETWIHEIDAVGLEENTNVSVVLDAYPNKTYSGRIKSITKQSELKPQWSRSAYFPAIIVFDDNPELTLMPGMSARILISKRKTEEVVERNQDGGADNA